MAKSAGIDLPQGRGLGVIIAEMTGDNRPDIYVANDSSPCWLFANRGNLQFEEIGEEAGVAVNARGDVISGMGVALGDLDGDGLSDLAVTNFIDRSTIVFRAQGRPRGVYRDASNWLGLVASTRRVLGFGIAMVNFDGDGHADLLQTNGHVLDRARLGNSYAMRPTLLRNAGVPLQDVSSAAGDWFDRPVLGRGLAVGDLDGDGRPDVAAAALDSPAALLQNTSRGGHFLNLELIDRHGRPAFGRGSGSWPAGGFRSASWSPVAAISQCPSRGCISGSARPRSSHASRWTGPGELRNPGPGGNCRLSASYASCRGRGGRFPDAIPDVIVSSPSSAGG